MGRSKHRYPRRLMLDEERDAIVADYLGDPLATSTTLGAKYKRSPASITKALNDRGIARTKHGFNANRPTPYAGLTVETAHGNKKKHRKAVSGQLLVRQRNKCAICRKRFTEKRKLAVDHCHKTNKIRGALCVLCNVGLGAFKDKISRLKRAIIYLKKSR